jgi:hypothetical protein
LEGVILDLLADRHPTRARDFVLAWGEHRNDSWVNASRDAEARAGSRGHLPQIRGQLRYHLGEMALAKAASAANVGSIPLRTKPPGGIFNVARVGRFALVSISVPRGHVLPRRSVTRKLLSQANEDLEPQRLLNLDGVRSARGATELAYFGCVIAVPWKYDPTVPAQLAFGVPNASLSEWIIWIPLHQLYALLQERTDSSRPAGSQIEIPDNVLPRFRLPKRDEDATDDGKGA